MTDIVEPFDPCATQKCKERCEIDNVCHSEEICLEEVESLRQQIAEWTNLFSEWDSPGEVHEALIGLQKDVNALRQQLATTSKIALVYVGNLQASSKQLAECQAREKVLRDALDNETAATENDGLKPLQASLEALAMPSDSTALDAMLKQAKREALLDAKHVAENMMALGYKIEAIVGDISNMAKELE